MGFLLFKVRIVYGWLLGLYEKERRDERLAIVNKYAREPIPHDVGWTPSRLIILRHDRFMWVVETVLLFAMLILTIPVAAFYGVTFKDGLPALVFHWWLSFSSTVASDFTLIYGRSTEENFWTRQC